MKNIEEIKKERTKPSRAEPREEKTKRIRQWRSDCLSLIAFLGGGGVVISLGFAGSRYMLFLPHLTVILRASPISLSLSLSLSVSLSLCIVFYAIFDLYGFGYFEVSSFFFFFWSAKFVTLLLSLSWNCVHSSEKLRYFKEIWILFFFLGVNNGIGRIQRRKLN